MSKQIQHSHIQDVSLMHLTFHYQQASDPGAVGAGLWWLDTSVGNPTSDHISYRNDTNTGWITL